MLGHPITKTTFYTLTYKDLKLAIESMPLEYFEEKTQYLLLIRIQT